MQKKKTNAKKKGVGRRREQVRHSVERVVGKNGGDANKSRLKKGEGAGKKKGPKTRGEEDRKEASERDKSGKKKRDGRGHAISESFKPDQKSPVLAPKG